MVEPYFYDWESHWEIEMFQNETDVEYTIPNFYQSSEDIVEV